MPAEVDIPQGLSPTNLQRLHELLTELKAFSPYARRYAVQILMQTLGGPGFTQAGHPTRGRRKVSFEEIWEEHRRRLQTGSARDLIQEEARELREFQRDVLGSPHPLSLTSIRTRILKRHGDLVRAAQYTQIAKMHRGLASQKSTPEAS